MRLISVIFTFTGRFLAAVFEVAFSAKTVAYVLTSFPKSWKYAGFGTVKSLVP